MNEETRRDESDWPKAFDQSERPKSNTFVHFRPFDFDGFARSTARSSNRLQRFVNVERRRSAFQKGLDKSLEKTSFLSLLLFQRSPLSPFVHPGELEILDRLTQLGRHYRTLNEFSEKTLENSASKFVSSLNAREKPRSSRLGGLYILSFAVELRSILHAYLQTLSELENECLIDQSLSLSHLLISLSDYALIFPQLVHLLSQLQSNGFRGCQLLDVIRRATLDGNTKLSSTMKHLLAATHRILLKQISSLLTRGELYDDFREFFIGLNKTINVEALGSTYNQYELIGEMLPSYISLPLAEKILFVGESWLLLKNNDDEMLSLDDEEKTQEIRDELNRLASSDELNLFELERIVERTRIELSLTLRNLFVERFQLCDELEQIRALFLLERGELFNLFVQRMGPLLLQTKKPSPALENDLNEIFKQCLNDLQLDSVLSKAEKFQFKLQFPVVDASTQVKNEEKFERRNSTLVEGDERCSTFIVATSKHRRNEFVRVLVVRLGASFTALQSEISAQSVFHRSLSTTLQRDFPAADRSALRSSRTESSVVNSEESTREFLRLAFAQRHVVFHRSFSILHSNRRSRIQISAVDSRDRH